MEAYAAISVFCIYTGLAQKGQGNDTAALLQLMISTLLVMIAHAAPSLFM